MNATTPTIASARSAQRVFAVRSPLLIAVLFLGLHAVLAASVDAADPNVFLRADRAGERLRVLQGLLQVDSLSALVDYAASHGVIGDYAVHAVLYLAGGQAGVVTVQVLLAVLSGLAVYRLARLLGLSRRLCTFAMSAYLALPHTLVFPHQLVTEALHVPLFVISQWLFVEGVKHKRSRLLYYSALTLALATLIRPITLLWPLVAGAALMIARRPRDGVLHASLATLPVLAWMLFIGMQTGKFGLGESGHSMEANLHARVSRITATLPAAERELVRETHLATSEKALSPTDYLRFAAAYPGPTLAHLWRDAGAFFVKSGVERIMLDYLPADPRTRVVQSSEYGWRRRLELGGVAHTSAFLRDSLGPALLIPVAGALAMLALVVLALIGAAHFVKQWRTTRRLEALLALTLAGAVIYTFAFSQVLSAMQSRQRAPVEFALVLLAAVGVQVWRRAQRQRACATAA